VVSWGLSSPNAPNTDRYRSLSKKKII